MPRLPDYPCSLFGSNPNRSGFPSLPLEPKRAEPRADRQEAAPASKDLFGPPLPRRGPLHSKRLVIWRLVPGYQFRNGRYSRYAAAHLHAEDEIMQTAREVRPLPSANRWKSSSSARERRRRGEQVLPPPNGRLRNHIVLRRARVRDRHPAGCADYREFPPPRVESCQLIHVLRSAHRGGRPRIVETRSAKFPPFC